jgi:hypothetical protein
MLEKTSELITLSTRLSELEELQLSRGRNHIRTREQYDIIMWIIELASKCAATIKLEDLNDKMD